MVVHGLWVQQRVSTVETGVSGVGATTEQLHMNGARRHSQRWRGDGGGVFRYKGSSTSADSAGNGCARNESGLGFGVRDSGGVCYGRVVCVTSVNSVWPSSGLTGDGRVEQASSSRAEGGQQLGN